MILALPGLFSYLFFHNKTGVWLLSISNIFIEISLFNANGSMASDLGLDYLSMSL